MGGEVTQTLYAHTNKRKKNVLKTEMTKPHTHTKDSWMVMKMKTRPTRTYGTQQRQS
jgi:hypothetical protein